ncbi:MAG: preprotein translocase subunit SecE [Desulfobacterales bacterium]
MGRLQRKKSSGAKKKKRQDTAPAEQAAEKNPSAPKSAGILRTVGKNPGSRPGQGAVAARPKAEPGRIKAGFEKSVQFLREVKVELKKVAWPSRKQTIGSTAVVLVLVLIISAFLGLVDFGLSGLIRQVLQ